MTLVRLGAEAGGRVEPRIERRPPESTARRAFYEAQDAGLLDSQGWLTPIAYEALRGES